MGPIGEQQLVGQLTPEIWSICRHDFWFELIIGIHCLFSSLFCSWPFFFKKTFHCFSFLLHWPKCSFGFFHKMLSFGQPQILLFWNGFKRQKILRTVQRTPVYPFCENSIQVSLMVSGMPFILEGPIQDHICVELSHLSRLLPSRVDASLFLNICRLGTL